MIGYVPTALARVAALAKVAVMLSPFLMPVRVPVKAGFGSPYRRLALVPVTDNGAGATASVPLFEVTVELPSFAVGSASAGTMANVPTALAGVAALLKVAVMLSAFLIPAI